MATNETVNIKPPEVLSLINQAQSEMGMIASTITRLELLPMLLSWFGGMGQGQGQQTLQQKLEVIQMLIKILEIYAQLQKWLTNSTQALNQGDQNQQSLFQNLGNAPISSYHFPSNPPFTLNGSGF
jgi:hypothetical protein